MKRKIIFSLLFIASAFVMFSCTEDSLEPTLTQNKDLDQVKNMEDLNGLVNGMYNRMTDVAYYGRDILLYGDVRSDNMYSSGNSGRIITPASMDMATTDAHTTDTWAAIYRVIASANMIISKEKAELDGDADLKSHLIGQAYAIRALAHFDLLRMYGQQHVTGGGDKGIPYVKEYKGADLFPPRSSVAEVKSFLYADLAEAMKNLKVSMDDPSGQFITTQGANAIKSRIALYFGDWAVAKTAADAVIKSGNYDIVSAADFVDSWKLDSPVNSVFALAFNSVDNAGINGLQYIMRGKSYGDVRVLDDILKIFDAGDVRNSPAMIREEVIGTAKYLTNFGKYPSADYSDDVRVIRFEEIVLIYAEALLETGDATNALIYLNMITAKRGATAYTVANKANILKERRRELAFEGFRFDDLARTRTDIPLVDNIRQRHNGPKYGSFRYAFPIPKSEINANANVLQNSGYAN